MLEENKAKIFFRSGDTRTTELLVDHGADINRYNNFNETPLFLAADYCENLELVEFLVKKGAHLNQITSYGQSPIMAAAVNGHLEIVKYLASKHADLDIKDKNDQTIIHLAAKHNRSSVIEEILDLETTPRDFMVNENDQLDNTPLHLACAEGFLETVRVLVEHGAEIDNKNEDEQTPFHMAASAGHTEVVEYICGHDKGAVNDLDEDDNTALHLAASNKMSQTVDVLLEHGSDVRKRNDKDWTPLDCAAASGSFKCAAKILEVGADVDPMDRKKTTPLHLTAIHGHPKVTKLLLDHGAKVDIETDEGRSALELAIEHGNKSVAEVILASDHWRSAMTASGVGPENNLDTPLRMLVRKFPDLATKVLDKCITKEAVTVREKKQTKVVFDFGFIEDTFNYQEIADTIQLKKVEAEEELGVRESSKIVRRYEYRPGDNPYSNNSLEVQDNHPLMIMANQKQKDLLKHSLCLALLRRKWNKFKYLFYFYLMFYCVYLALITSYVLIDMDQVGKEQTNAKLLLSFRIPIVSVIGFGLFLEILDLFRVKL